MDDNFSEVNIIHKDYIIDFENKFFELISGRTELDEHFLVQLKNSENNVIEDDENSTHNINVGIAAAITAYARIHMSQFKNNPEFNLYYSDTDSIYIDRPLPGDLVNSKTLGKMKLENILTDAIFLAPKFYCLLTKDGKLIHKVKGLSHDIELTIDDFNQLLYKDSLIKKNSN